MKIYDSKRFFIIFPRGQKWEMPRFLKDRKRVSYSSYSYSFALYIVTKRISDQQEEKRPVISPYFSSIFTANWLSSAPDDVLVLKHWRNDALLYRLYHPVIIRWLGRMIQIKSKTKQMKLIYTISHDNVSRTFKSCRPASFFDRLIHKRMLYVLIHT
jgi:hypothetical protein